MPSSTKPFQEEAVAYYYRGDKHITPETAKKSKKFAQILISNYSPEIMQRGKVDKAGFKVLKASNTPGISFYLGFLSHKKDVKKLGSLKYQWGIAQNIFKSLRQMKARQ